MSTPRLFWRDAAAAATSRPLALVSGILLVAIVLNIGAAWWSALQSEVRKNPGATRGLPPWDFDYYEGPTWTALVMSPWNPTQPSSPDDPVAPAWSMAARDSVPRGLGQTELILEEAHGWPFHSLISRQRGAFDQVLGHYRFKPMQGVVLPGPIRLWPQRAPRALPTSPIPLGLAANIALYSLPLWTVVTLARLALMRRRRSRGACPRCGYPRGSSTVCAECGFAHASPAEGPSIEHA